MRALRFWQYGKQHKTLFIVGSSAMVLAVPAAQSLAFHGSSEVPQSEPASSLHTSAASTSQNSSQNSSEPNTPPSDSSATNSNSTKITVNGQSIPVPQNGEVHKTITNDGGQTNVDISSQQSATNQNGVSHNHSSSHVNISSNSSINVQSNEQDGGGL